MINPIAQMKQRNANRKRSEIALNPQKATSKANPKPNTNTAQKRKQTPFHLSPQISRMFDQTNASIEHCKAYFPDCYHHKHQLAKECEAIAEVLRNGGLLLAQLVKLNGDHTLNAEQKAVLQNFNQVSRYLVANFNTTAKHVKAVEGGTATKCYSDRFKPQGVTANE